MKGTYEIKDYEVALGEITETRQAIIYYNTFGVEETGERYTDDYIIQAGYVERNSIVAEQQDEE
jgi:hypothetical protein